MKVFILTSLLVVAASASLLEENLVKFQAFKIGHGKAYKNQAEEAQRFAIFQENLRSIDEHNALYEQGLVSYKQGINQFTDMTQKEFEASLVTFAEPAKDAIDYVKTGVPIPASKDWRAEGQVTNVKNQQQCGSCWAFAVVGSIEAAYYRQSGKLVSLSVQELVDCTTDTNAGCSGGSFGNSFEFILKYGLQSEESYPYKAQDGVCLYNSSLVIARISSYVSLKNDEKALLEVVGSIGPVSIAIDASYLSTYASGIYSDNRCIPGHRNHAVLIVGYGSESGQDYWIVKNSWGASWGEDGYFKILRGVNECCVAEDDVYPVV